MNYSKNLHVTETSSNNFINFPFGTYIYIYATKNMFKEIGLLLRSEFDYVNKHITWNDVNQNY